MLKKLVGAVSYGDPEVGSKKITRSVVRIGLSLSVASLCCHWILSLEGEKRWTHTSVGLIRALVSDER
jgi:hypothetical protein